ncbi:hypothetical protein BKI52_21195 [marine bacterium AO1-C]|nr:hypothetical protein BKI52_21195 [marine bacterium AO1-C]
MQTPEFIEKTQRQIAKGQLDAALKSLTTFLKDKKTLYNDAINQAGRYAELQNQLDAGTILPQEAEVQKSQIRTTVLNLLDRLEQAEGSAALAAHNPTTTPKKNKTTQMALIGVGVLVLVIAGIFIGQKLNKGGKESNKTNNTVAKVDSTGNEGKKVDSTNKSDKTTDNTSNKNRSTADNGSTNNARTATNLSSGNNNSENTSNSGVNTSSSTGIVDFDAIKLDVQVKTHKPIYSVAEGEDIKVLVKVNKPSYVTVIYNEESGKKSALIQNKFIDKSRVNQWVMVSNGGAYVSTKGNESVFAVALNKRLPTLVEKDDYIITDLTNWLKGVEQKVNSEVQGRGVKRRYSNAKYNFKSQ